MNKFSKTFLTVTMAGLLMSTSFMTGTNVKAASTNRISGPTRYDTAIAVATQGWTSCNTVILASGENFPDALCAGPLAHVYDAPILLTHHDTLDTNVEQKILALGAKNVIIVGGTGAVSQAIEDRLTDTDKLTVTRLWGDDRYKTSLAVAKEVEAKNGTQNFKGFYIAYGRNYPDALSASPFASMTEDPILLTDTNSLSADIANYLDGLKNITDIEIVGGTGVISSAVEKQLDQYVPAYDVEYDVHRYGGSDRYSTNAQIIKAFSGIVQNDDNPALLLATGTGYADALVGSAYAAKIGAPIVITDGTLSSEQQDALLSVYSSEGNITVYGLGGTGVLSDNIINMSSGLINADTPKITAFSLTDTNNSKTIISANIDQVKNTISLTIPSTVKDLSFNSATLSADLSKAELDITNENIGYNTITKLNISKTDNLSDLINAIFIKNGYNPADGILAANVEEYFNNAFLTITGTDGKTTTYLIQVSIATAN